VPDLKKKPFNSNVEGFSWLYTGPCVFKADEIEILKGEKLKDQRRDAL
jgi:hypothetical protein